jgi:DNA-directed RNA polymerase specialized sigma24 family protein
MGDSGLSRKQFEDGIQRSWEAMRGRARRAVGENWSEDVVMNAFATAFAHPRWTEVRRPETWILGVLDNEIRAHRGRQGRVEEHERAWSPDDAADERDDFTERVADEDETACQMKAIKAAMDEAGLSGREDYVARARLRGEDDEIAEALGIGRNAVRAYHSQAVAKIRGAMATERLSRG